MSVLPNHAEPDDPFTVALDAGALKKRTLRGSFVTVFIQIIKMGVQLGSQLVLARLLFPADFGLLAMAAPLIALAQVITDIGLGQAIIQRPVLVHANVSALFWVNIALSCGLAVLFAATSPLAASIFGEPKLAAVILTLSAAIPISALSIHPFALLSRQMRFELIAKFDLVSAITGIATSVIFAWIGWGYWSLVVGQMVTTVLNCMLGWSSCRWRPSRPALHPNVWTDLKFGGRLAVANLANYVTSSADNVIVGLSAGAVSLGLYDRSYRLVVQPLSQMIIPISRVAVPLLSRLNDRPDEYRTAYLHLVRALLWSSTPGMLVCISSGYALIQFVLGERWLAAAPVFSWICVGGLASATYASASWLFISQGRAHELMRATTINSAINVLSFLIGAFWGIVGIASVAAAAFVLITTPLLLLSATQRGPVRRKDMLECLVPNILCGFVTFIVLKFVGQALTTGILLQLVLLTALSYACFSVLMLLSPGGRRHLKELGRIRGLLKGAQ